MKSKNRTLPKTPAEWRGEIALAMADAREAQPFGTVIGKPITDADLFHMAPLVCLKFRGRKQRGAEAERITKTALANYVANTGPDAPNHELEQRPFMAFALCYIASHLALEMLDRQQAETILNYCEERLDDE